MGDGLVAGDDLPAQVNEISVDVRAGLLRVHAICDRLCNKTKLPWRSSLATWYARKALPHVMEPIRCPTIYGFDLVLDETTSGSVYRFGFYEAGTLDFMQRHLRPGDVFVDAGASVGMMSLFAAFCVGDAGTVLAFEPLKKRYQQLVSSVRINARRNIRVFPFGLGNAARGLSIFTDRASPSMVVDTSSRESEPTRVERLDEVLAAGGVEHVRMIKVDVEGFELEVLQGCEALLRGPTPPILCVEYGVYAAEAMALLTFLRSLDHYRLYQLSGTKKYASKLVEVSRQARPRAGDNLFCIPVGPD